MASHITITPSATTGITAGKSPNAQAGADATADGGLLGAFAVLLGGAVEANGGTTTAAQSAEASLNLGNLVDLSFGFGSQSDPEDPEAVAAPIDAVLPIQTNPDMAAAIADLTALIDGLADLKAGMDAGAPLDPDLLQRLDASLEALAAALEIDLDALPDLSALTALVSGLLPEDGSVTAQLTTALGPLAQAMAQAAANTEMTGTDMSGLVKSIGDKLAAILQGLNGGDIDPAKLAELGLDAQAMLDADLQAAIARLTAPAVKVDATPAAIVLAAPELKLTEPVLTGKVEARATTSTDAGDAAATQTPEATPQLSAEADTETEAGTDQDRRDDPKPEIKVEAKATVVAAPIEKMPETQASALTQHQASRIDAAAAPRLVQAGYQTSQQQLNLPQLAFELVRQVNDGNTRFQMRLDPPELGKIDVRLDIDSTGQVNARLTVEKAETLDLMQRDQRALERALQQAGLDGAKTNLEFSLKQNPFSGGQQGQGGNGRPSLFGEEGGTQADDLPPPTVTLYRGSLTASGVNIIA